MKVTPVPGIEWAVIPGFAACGEDKVIGDIIATAKAIVCIDPSTRTIEKDVTLNDGLCSLSLDIEARLLLIESHLPRRVGDDRVVPGMFPVGSVNTRLRIILNSHSWTTRIRGCLIGESPRSNRVASNEGKVGVLDCCVPVVPGNHDSVAVETFESAPIDVHSLCPLEENCREAIQSPVTRRWHAMTLHVGRGRCSELDILDGDILDRVPLRAGLVDEDLVLL